VPTSLGERQAPPPPYRRTRRPRLRRPAEDRQGSLYGLAAPRHAARGAHRVDVGWSVFDPTQTAAVHGVYAYL